jgi:hypothetical protein
VVVICADFCYRALVTNDVDPNPPAVLRLYAEFVTACAQGEFRSALDALLTPSTLQGLKQVRSSLHDTTQLRIAVQVELTADNARMVELQAEQLLQARRVLHALQIEVDVWPVLADHAGRFLNGDTAGEYQKRLLPLLHALARQDRRNSPPMGICLDVEPNASQLHQAWAMQQGSAWQRLRGSAQLTWSLGRGLRNHKQGQRDVLELLHDLRARGSAVHTAIPPPALDGMDAVYSWLMSCPLVDSDGESLFPQAAAMCYPRLWRRDNDDDMHHRTLALWAARHRLRSDAIIIGLLSTGMMGNEPTVPSMASLQQDLAAIRALHFRDVAVYSLEGLLFGSRGCPSDGLRADLDAWCHTIATTLGVGAVRSAVPQQAVS